MYMYDVATSFFAGHLLSAFHIRLPSSALFNPYIYFQSIRHSITVLSSEFHSFIHSLIHSGYFYSASSSPLLLRGALDTVRVLFRSFTPKRHRKLRVKDLPKVHTWRLERGSNPRPSGRHASTLPMRHHAPFSFKYMPDSFPLFLP